MLCLPYILFNRKVRSPLAIIISETEGLGTNLSSGRVEKGKGEEEDRQDHLKISFGYFASRHKTFKFKLEYQEFVPNIFKLFPYLNEIKIVLTCMWNYSYTFRFLIPMCWYSLICFMSTQI